MSSGMICWEPMRYDAIGFRQANKSMQEQLIQLQACVSKDVYNPAVPPREF